MTIPIINVAPLCRHLTKLDYQSPDVQELCTLIGEACKSPGFFYISGWEEIVSSTNVKNLELLAKDFFLLSENEKMNISMKKSGLHWKGYFPSGDELTSGKPDAKEGIYFGEEYSLDSSQVQNKMAMHGPNQFPGKGKLQEEWKRCVRLYMDQLTELGLCLMRGISVSLKLPPYHFEKIFCQPKPFTPFRIFRYPSNDSRQGVGRHTDYGVLTILKQDHVGGLEVEVNPGQWTPAPPIDGTFVVNIGDMLEIWTSGYYKATPHRVVSGLSETRMSMPFFFDPAFDAIIDPKDLQLGSITLKNAAGESEIIIGGATSKTAGGGGTIRYGDYISHKVANVFPELFKSSGGNDRLSKL
jgi:isopenicillin N synthase-like dioxygenase